MTIGYPPIPGFDAIQIADKSYINSVIRSSSGILTAGGTSYLDNHDYFLINVRVKGGNSGGPVVNHQGRVIGMIVQIPNKSSDQLKLDEWDTV